MTQEETAIWLDSGQEELTSLLATPKLTMKHDPMDKCPNCGAAKMDLSASDLEEEPDVWLHFDCGSTAFLRVDPPRLLQTDRCRIAQLILENTQLVEENKKLIEQNVKLLAEAGKLQHD